ncbi:hypothetical protein MC378_09370 [Polaribacter sp. MSW13]|uniref:Outer membrane protein beta-barrel domain-containing protein n=1 Tax=Polaribacter marinus TaxID=2916838 RepID=A0A9X1VMQ8_9FLAO|nr:hypothetical protein [Polaribacter marinus]MCI2229374.1 hypothetical protein [Polaribacter marinus]
MKKLFLLICCFLFVLPSYGQNNIEISLQQDVRLITVGDKKGNAPLTLNLLSKIEIPTYKLKKNYLSTYISIEYADLVKKNYKRFALGAGYVVKSVYKKIGVATYIDFGRIYREKDGFYSFSISGELNYKINNRLKLIFTQQLTQRKDLKMMYSHKNGNIISGFFGLKYSL